MNIKLRDWLIILALVLIVGIGVRFIPIQFVQNLSSEPNQADAWIAFGTILLAIATFILAIAAFLAITYNNRIERLRNEREFKVRLITDLMGWCTESSDWVHEFEVNKLEDVMTLINNMSRTLALTVNIAAVLDKAKDDTLLLIGQEFSKCLVSINQLTANIKETFENITAKGDKQLSKENRTKLEECVEGISYSYMQLRIKIIEYRMESFL